MEKLVMAFISIKRKCYLADFLQLKQAPDITKYFFNLNTDLFKQESRILHKSF